MFGKMQGSDKEERIVVLLLAVRCKRYRFSCGGLYWVAAALWLLEKCWKPRMDKWEIGV